MAEVACDRALACLSAVELAERGIPGELDACVALVAAREACNSRTETNTCGAGEVFQPDEARACVDESAAQRCSELGGDGDIVLGDLGDSEVPAPPVGACERVCLASGTDQLGQACDVADQAACGPGNKCAFVLENPSTGAGTTQCVPDGDRGPGAECYESTAYGSYDECRAGLVCRQSQCQPMCLSRADCGGGELCVPEGASDLFGYCVATCDPFAQDCPASQGCYPWDGASSVCLHEGYGAYPCQVPEDCERGDTCARIDGQPQCARMCNAALYDGQPAPQCGSFEACYALAGRTDGIGVCVYNPG